jgi:hypothetical protein
MQSENYTKIINAIDVYDDPVLIAARDFAHLLRTEDIIDTSALNAALLDDRPSDWERPCWCHDDIRAAIAMYEDEDHSMAAHYLVKEMLQRSRSWEQSFV